MRNNYATGVLSFYPLFIRHVCRYETHPALHIVEGAHRSDVIDILFYLPNDTQKTLCLKLFKL